MAGLTAHSLGAENKPLGPMLRLAIQAGSVAAILARLRHGDAVHARDSQGRTPLMLAALRGHVDVCKVLLAHEADALARDHQGRTALELARHGGHLGVVAMLLDYSGAVAETASPTEQQDAANAGVQASNGWEPESEERAPKHDESCVRSSALLQESIRAHTLVDRDEEWGDVNVDLPVPVASGGSVALDIPTRGLLRRAFTEALDAGWINPDQLLDVLCGRRESASETEVELARKSIQRLTDHGVVVDDESWLSPDYGGADEDCAKSDEIEAMISDVEGFISPRHEPLWSFARSLKFAGPLLDHDGEIGLGSALQGGIQRAVMALCCDSQAAAFVLSALEARACSRQVDPESGDDSVTYHLPSLGFQSHDPEAEDPTGVNGQDESSIDGPSVNWVRSAAEKVASLRQAVEYRLTSSNPEVDGDLQQLVHHAIAGAEMGVVQLVELGARIPLGQMGSSAREAFGEGLWTAMQARDQLARSNLRLVWSIARKYTFSGMPLLDLIQEGSIGLMRAVDRYDYTRGFRFHVCDLVDPSGGFALGG